MKTVTTKKNPEKLTKPRKVLPPANAKALLACPVHTVNEEAPARR